MKHCFINQLLWVSCYVLLLLFMSVFFSVALTLFRTARGKTGVFRPQRTRNLRSILGLLALGVCFGFFYDSMFVRFSCIQISSSQIVLIYFWPKPVRVISFDDLVQAEVERDRRGGGELVVTSKAGAYRSIVCTTTVKLNPARDAIHLVLQREQLKK